MVCGKTEEPSGFFKGIMFAAVLAAAISFGIKSCEWSYSTTEATLKVVNRYRSDRWYYIEFQETDGGRFTSTVYVDIYNSVRIGKTYVVNTYNHPD